MIDKRPLRLEITKPRQEYVDRPVYAQPKVLANSVRAALRLRTYGAEVCGLERVTLNWVRPAQVNA